MTTLEKKLFWDRKLRVYSLRYPDQTIKGWMHVHLHQKVRYSRYASFCKYNVLCNHA